MSPRGLTLSAFAAGAISLATQPGGACAQVLTGHVIEGESGKPVRHATLELLDQRARILVRVNVDSAGAFRVRQWEPGKYQLKAKALGYATASSAAFDLATGDVVDVTIRLDADAVRLEPVVVNARARETLAEMALAGYYDRRAAGQRMGAGRFLERSTIAQRGRTLTQVLATVTGLRVLYLEGCTAPVVSMVGNAANRLQQARGMSRLRADNCQPLNVCRASIYIDGVEMMYNEAVSIDHAVPLDWIEAIEVYRRPSETPAEFLGRASCGVVAIWTRRG